MHQGVGIEETFHCRSLIVNSAELQKELLLKDQIIYASADETAPDDLEHDSIYSYPSYFTAQG